MTRHLFAMVQHFHQNYHENFAWVYWGLVFYYLNLDAAIDFYFHQNRTLNLNNITVRITSRNEPTRNTNKIDIDLILHSVQNDHDHPKYRLPDQYQFHFHHLNVFELQESRHYCLVKQLDD